MFTFDLSNTMQRRNPVNLGHRDIQADQIIELLILKSNFRSGKSLKSIGGKCNFSKG